MRHSPTISCTAARILPSFWAPKSPEPELTEEKDVEEEEEEENDDVVSIAGSVEWREREVDTVDCDAGGRVSTKASPVGAGS
jgi:hypothetical protein